MASFHRGYQSAPEAEAIAEASPLAKYVACPPIAVRRIMNYDGKHVRCWYNDHKTKARKVETVEVYTFIGRMVEHIFPKGFQRVRYYGLQATKTFSKWKEAIKKGLKRIGRVVKGAYQVVEKKTYRQRYKEVSGRDPLVCRYCGGEMDIWRIWHPKYGTIYDEWEEMKAGKYEQKKEREDRGGFSLWPSSKILQLSLFELQT